MAVITNAGQPSLENLDNSSLENQVYFNFINSLRSPDTKQTYEINLKHYLKFCNFTKLSDLLTIQEIK